MDELNHHPAFRALRPLLFVVAGGAAWSGGACIPVEIAWDESASSSPSPSSASAPTGASPTESVGTATGVLSVVLGQSDFTSLKSLRRGQSLPKAVATDGSRLAVADSGANRVLIWNSIPTSSSVPPDVVVGQATFNTTSSGLSATQLNTPTGVAFAGGRLIVADRSNHRVLIWNSVPVANGTPADVVVGQPNMNTASSTATQSGLSQPGDVATDGVQLFVADTGHHRILSWNTIPVTSGTNADHVIGQSNFITAVVNHGGSTDLLGLSFPESLSLDGSRLVVADKGNNRVLIYSPVPTSNYPAASYYLGQAGPSSATASGGAVGMTGPQGVHLGADGKLYVGDTGNNRVLFWNTVPVASAISANGILGQSTFGVYTATLGVSGLSGPTRITSLGSRVWVADSMYNRTMEWSSVAISSWGSAATRVLGQSSFNRSSVLSPGLDATTLMSAYSVYFDGTRLFVADRSNHRVLIWNSLPAASDQPADVVVGQVDFVSNVQATTAAGLNTPSAVYSDGTKLYVADTSNNRVLIWNTIPTVNGTSADLVLGQPNFTSGALNNGGISNNTFYAPSAITVAAGRLLVADYYNNRVLIWNNLPNVQRQPADRVIGQLTFATSASGTTANGLSYPNGICSDGVRFFVTEQANNRALGWNAFPVADGESASVVLGQPDFVSGAGAGGSTGLNSPQGCSMYGSRLAIADSVNNRVLLWNSLPVGAGAPAHAVLGQSSLSSVGPNGSAGLAAVAASTFYSPISPFFDGNRIFVVDSANQRVQVLPMP